jgi:hypothetical protein
VGLDAERFQFGEGCFQMLGFAPVDNEVAAAFSQSSGNLLTNPTAGAGDKRPFVFQAFRFLFSFSIDQGNLLPAAK